LVPVDDSAAAHEAYGRERDKRPVWQVDDPSNRPFATPPKDCAAQVWQTKSGLQGIAISVRGFAAEPASGFHHKQIRGPQRKIY
jgi:hypothetical protein